MITRTQTVKLAIFLLGCASIATGLFVFFVREQLFESTAPYYVRVPGSVNGLAPGASVSIRGVRVGEVEDIELYADDSRSVRLTLAIDREASVFRDAQATLSFQGLSGLKFVEITGGGGDGAGVLPPGSYVPYQQSILEQVTDEAAGLLQRADQLLATTNTLVQHVANATGQLDAKRLESIVSNADAALARFAAAGAELEDLIRDTRPSLQRTLASAESTFQGAGGVTQDARAVLRNTNQLVSELQSVVRANEDQLRAITYNLREATQSFKYLGRELRQRPSRLLVGDAPPERELP
jgi:phospholipid/cholesterol/gamma-HCH transport system substrate-binding protein